MQPRRRLLQNVSNDIRTNLPHSPGGLLGQLLAKQQQQMQRGARGSHAQRLQEQLSRVSPKQILKKLKLGLGKGGGYDRVMQRESMVAGAAAVCGICVTLCSDVMQRTLICMQYVLSLMADTTQHVRNCLLVRYDDYASRSAP